MVSQAREPALNTGEGSLIGAISFIDMTTAGTGTACVAWVNRDHWHAHLLGLVFDKGAELGKRPARQGCSLGLSSRYPLANMRQFFQRNTTSGVFSLCNNVFANRVVYIFGETLFFAGQFLEAATRRLRAFALQLSAQFAVTEAHSLHALALVNGSVTVGGNVGNAQVNTQEVINFIRGWFVYVAALVEVKLASAVDQVALAAQALKQLGGMFTDHEGHLLATCHCPDRDNALIEFVGDKPVVEGERTVWLEGAFGAFVELVAIGNFGKDAYRNICAESKLCAHAGVTEFVQLELSKNTFLPGNITDVVARSIGRFQCLQKQSVLSGGRLQFDARNQFHAHIIPSIGILGKLGIQEDAPIPHPR